MLGVWCLVFGACCLVFGVWCLVFCVWYPFFDVWCLELVVWDLGPGCSQAGFSFAKGLLHDTYHSVDYEPFIRCQLARTKSTLRSGAVQIWPCYPPETGGQQTLVVHRIHLTQCTHWLLLESQLPHKIVNSLFMITDQNKIQTIS